MYVEDDEDFIDLTDEGLLYFTFVLRPWVEGFTFNLVLSSPLAYSKLVFARVWVNLPVRLACNSALFIFFFENRYFEKNCILKIFKIKF